MHEYLLKAMGMANIWTFFRRQNILDIFERQLWLALCFGMDRILEMSESYTTTLNWPILSTPRRYDVTIRPVGEDTSKSKSKAAI